jgi:CubicO group peptidase (beta-lactamase class C family)
MISTRRRITGLALPLAAALAPSTVTRLQHPPPTPIIWPTETWPSSSPDAHGLPANLTARIDQHVAATTPLLTSLLVVRGGDLVIDRHYNGFQPDQTFHIWSVTKSVSSIAAGIALREGLLTSVSQTLGELIPGRIPAAADPRVATITLEHLLTSTSGWAWDARGNFSRHDETDDLDLMLARPMVCDPGDCFEYDSTNSNLLSYIIQVQSGITMADYLQPRLFDPLDIPAPEWVAMYDGATRGAGGLYLTPGDMTKLGLLYLHGGEWDGERIVDEEWVTTSTRRQASGTSTISGVNIGGGGDYGYQWWVKTYLGLPAYYGNGYGGQTLYVVPDLDLVVATAVAGTDVDEPENQQPVLPIIEETIIPAALEGGAGTLRRIDHPDVRRPRVRRAADRGTTPRHLGQVGDLLRRNALPGRQHRDTRRVGHDQLGRDLSHRGGQRHRSHRREEGLPGCEHLLAGGGHGTRRAGRRDEHHRAGITLTGDGGERGHQPVDACGGVADGHQADDADQVAHLDRHREPLPQVPLGLEPGDAEPLDVDHQAGGVVPVGRQPQACPVDNREAGNRTDPIADVSREAQRPVEHVLAIHRHLPATGIEGGQDRHERARRLTHTYRGRQPSHVDPRTARVEYRCLADPVEELVRAGDRHIRATRHRRPREHGMEREMRTPRLVDIERHVAEVGDSRDGVGLRGDPPVRRGGEHHEACRRMGVQGIGHGTRIGAQRHVEPRVHPRCDVDRCGAGEHECRQQGGMHIPGDDHLISRIEQGKQRGVIAGGRAVGEEERPVGAPGVGRERLRVPLDRVQIGGVEPDIG